MDYSVLGIKTNPVTIFTAKDKEKYLSDPSVIDVGIRELADAVNAVEVLFTMNSCQGFLIEAERDYHCPETYVDFYVIDEAYPLANMLLASLVSKFNAVINCKVVYEADFDFISPDEVVGNGFVNMRHSIELFELPPELMKKTYQEIIQHIKQFAEMANKNRVAVG